MKDVKIYKEEFDTTQEEIERAEQLWKAPFPQEYKDFLLKNNGGVPYPYSPTIASENNSELWVIERFLSIGDLVLQKQYPMSYTLHDLEEVYFRQHPLHHDFILVFAIAERGIYFFNLNPSEYGQIYFANFSGGDGIIKVDTKSFSVFIGSFEVPKWSEEEYDPNYQMTSVRYPLNKIFQTHLFRTPDQPELGLNRFKEVFEVLGDIQPPEDGYPNIAQKYVEDRVKLEYLLQNGCATDGLLCYAVKAETIAYLVNEKKLDINKIYKGRYPLQNYLTVSLGYEVKLKYELIAKLLEMGIEMDWSIEGRQVSGPPDLPMIKKLEKLNEEYLTSEIKDKNWWIKNGKPEGHVPFIKSKLIEGKLGYVR